MVSEPGAQNSTVGPFRTLIAVERITPSVSPAFDEPISGPASSSGIPARRLAENACCRRGHRIENRWRQRGCGCHRYKIYLPLSPATGGQPSCLPTIPRTQRDHCNCPPAKLTVSESLRQIPGLPLFGHLTSATAQWSIGAYSAGTHAKWARRVP